MSWQASTGKNMNTQLLDQMHLSLRRELRNTLETIPLEVLQKILGSLEKREREWLEYLDQLEPQKQEAKEQGAFEAKVSELVHIIELRKLLDTNPLQAVQELEDFRDHILHQLQQKAKMVARAFAKIDLRELGLQLQGQGTQEKLRVQLEQASSLQEVEKIVKEQKLKGPKALENLVHLQEEIAQLDTLLAKIQGYIEPWKSQAHNIAKEVSQTYRYLRDTLPKAVETKFEDKEFAKWLREELDKEKFQGFMPTPSQQEQILQRAITTLQNPALQQKRFMKAKKEIGQELEKQQRGKSVQKHLTTLKNVLDSYLDINDQTMSLLSSMSQKNMALDNLVRTYLQTIARRASYVYSAKQAASEGADADLMLANTQKTTTQARQILNNIIKSLQTLHTQKKKVERAA